MPSEGLHHEGGGHRGRRAPRGIESPRRVSQRQTPPEWREGPHTIHLSRTARRLWTSEHSCTAMSSCSVRSRTGRFGCWFRNTLSNPHQRSNAPRIRNWRHRCGSMLWTSWAGSSAATRRRSGLYPGGLLTLPSRAPPLPRAEVPHALSPLEEGRQSVAPWHRVTRAGRCAGARARSSNDRGAGT